MFSLRPGHHLYRVAGSWRHAAPDDRFVRISGPDAELRAFQAHAHAHGAVVPATDPPDTARLVALFGERELLAEPVDAVERNPPRLIVCGDGPVAAAVSALVARWAEPVRCTPDTLDEPAVAEADLVIDCAGWLPDSRWRRLDGWCAAHATAWHRSHAEGTSFMIGPFTVPGRSAGYGDLRGRRLAASGVPDELIAHWRYLDGDGPDPDPTPPVPWPGAGVTSVVAGLIVDDVQRWWRSDRLEPVAHQVEVTVDPVVVHRHPVLPLPVTAGPRA